jgi:cytochrome b561
MPTLTAHFDLALLFSGLIVLHAAAALYHLFAKADRLPQRLRFGGRL